MIAHKVKILLGVVLAICLAMAMPSFASPSLSDADISFNVKAYYVKYAYRTTWQQGYNLNASGEIVPETGGAYRLVSDFIPVSGYKTVFTFFSISNYRLFPVLSWAFYDSEQNFIADSFHYNENAVFLEVPSSAVYMRIGQRQGPSVFICRSPDVVDYSNYSQVWGEFENVTIDSGGTILIPYQVYGFTQICIDFRFFGSIYQFSNIGMKVLSEYTDSSNYDGLLNYGDGQVLVEPYILNGDNMQTSAVASSSSNPASFAFNIPHSEFSGFLLYVPVNIPNGNVSTAVKVKVYDFQLDGEDVSARLEVDRVLDQLDDLVDQLALPSPDLDILLDVGNVLNNTNDTNASGIMSVIASDGGIITTMMVISVSVTVLGYILFGKKEA